jgi:hypothetical protein
MEIDNLTPQRLTNVLNSVLSVRVFELPPPNLCRDMFNTGEL